MTYKFACPLEGCSAVMTAEADTRPEAVDKLALLAKDHLATVHPDIQKTQEQIHEDISKGTEPQE